MLLLENFSDDTFQKITRAGETRVHDREVDRSFTSELSLVMHRVSTFSDAFWGVLRGQFNFFLDSFVGDISSNFDHKF